MINFPPTFWMSGLGDGGGVGGHFYVFTLLHVSEHSEHFCYWRFLWSEKLIIFTDGGYPLPPFAENSAKIINLIFEPFPYQRKVKVWIKQIIHQEQTTIDIRTLKPRKNCAAWSRPRTKRLRTWPRSSVLCAIKITKRLRGVGTQTPPYSIVVL